MYMLCSIAAVPFFVHPVWSAEKHIGCVWMYSMLIGALGELVFGYFNFYSKYNDVLGCCIRFALLLVKSFGAF